MTAPDMLAAIKAERDEAWAKGDKLRQALADISADDPEPECGACFAGEVATMDDDGNELVYNCDECVAGLRLEVDRLTAERDRLAALEKHGASS